MPLCGVQYMEGEVRRAMTSTVTGHSRRGTMLVTVDFRTTNNHTEVHHDEESNASFGPVHGSDGV